VAHESLGELPEMKPPKFDPKANDEAFAKHRTTPEVSLEDHVCTTRVGLGRAVMKLERVYLDLCFWIPLRDAHLGRSKDEGAKRLLQSLRESVRAGKRICPISEAIFYELLKQEDLHTRLEMAKLMDELSGGVALLTTVPRIKEELKAFLLKDFGQQTELLESVVWSRASCLVLDGTLERIDTLMGIDMTLPERSLHQKVIFDVHWDMGLSEIVEMREGDKLPVDESGALASRLTTRNLAQAGSITTFEKLYNDEMVVCLNSVAPIAYDWMLAYSQAMVKSAISLSDEEKTKWVDWCHSRLYKAMTTKKETHMVLRTIHILALCYAAVRWEKKRPLKANDIYDFQHAAAALAYYDVFLTEKPLAHLLKQGFLKFHEQFPCVVISDMSEAVKWAKK
jgi:hypothetical protein